MNRKYDQQTMQLISMFEQMTGSKLRDCFRVDDLQVFVVERGQIGRAVGKSGANVKKLAIALKSKIKIIEYSPQITEFVANTVHPIKPKRVEYDDDLKIALITPPDLLSRGLLIGRQAIKLRETEKIVQRFFDIVELKVGRPEEGPQTVEEAQALERPVQTIGDVASHPTGLLEESANVAEEPTTEPETIVSETAEPQTIAEADTSEPAELLTASGSETDEPQNAELESESAARPLEESIDPAEEKNQAQPEDEAMNTEEPSPEEELPEGAEVEGAGLPETEPSKKERKTE
jgi:transcription termination/antitermination protein NusA